jgi:hypothetical protein
MKYILSAILIFTTLCGFSQKNRIGLKGGYILSSQYKLDFLDTKPLSSFFLGISYTIKASKKIAFQPEVLYSIKGSRINGGKLKLNYIDVPFLMTYRVSNFSFLAGPQLSYCYKAKWEDEVENYEDNTSLANIGVVL